MIEKLDLRFVRNYDHAFVELSPHINVFFGDNGVGKTTLLEAVNVLSTTRSFRTPFLSELVQNQKESSKITIFHQNHPNLSLEIAPRRKTFKVGEKKITKHSDFLGNIPVLVLAPEHHLLIEGSKKDRLMYLDQILIQTNKEHLYLLKNHQKVLQQKRALLLQNLTWAKYQDEVGVWDAQHIDFTNKIRKLRKQLTETLHPLFVQNYQELAQTQTLVNLTYCYSEENPGVAQKEFFSKRILSGQQRDELQIDLHNHQSKRHASQGEKSSLLLSLKFAELLVLKNHGIENPIFLLDDIGATLDKKRRKQLFAKIQSAGYQALVSTCDENVVCELQNQLNDVVVFTQQNKIWSTCQTPVK